MSPETEVSSPVKNEALVRPQVIVVDDEESIRVLFEKILLREGLRVEVYNSGYPALEALKTRDFDLIISDYRIPDYNGIDLIQEAKKFHPQIGAILVTGVGTEQTIIDAFTKGHVDYYISKPIDIDQFKQQVRLALREVGLRKKEEDFHKLLSQKVNEATDELQRKNDLLTQKEGETRNLLRTLQEERENIQKTNELLERLSITDALTQLHNRRFLQDRGDEEVFRAKRYGTALSCILLDIDDFKKLNDSYGHLVGDEALKHMANIVSKGSRQIDIVARYGGEEFVLVLPEVDLEGASILAERLRKSISDGHFTYAGESYKFTSSFGVSAFDATKGIKSVNDLIKAADQAMYKAKELGKNRVVLHTPSGLIPIGKTDVITTSEKRAILREVSRFVNSSYRLDEILNFLLNKIHKTVGRESPKFAANVMLWNEGKILTPTASIRSLKEDLVIQLAIQVQETGDSVQAEVPEGGETYCSFPIQYVGAMKKKVGVGVLTLNMVPADKEFIMDLVDVAAVAIKNAKINYDLESSKAALEKKLVESQVIHATLEAITQNRKDGSSSWGKLLGTIVKNIGLFGVRKVVGYVYDPNSGVLSGGKATPGVPTPKSISTSQLTKESQIRKILANDLSTISDGFRIFYMGNDLPPEDVALARSLKLTPPYAIFPIVIEEETHGLIFVENSYWSSDLLESLRNFVERVNLTLENFHLDRNIRDKGNRLVLLSDLIQEAHLLAKPSQVKKFLNSNIEKLAVILDSRQISLYTYDEEEESYVLNVFYGKEGNPPKKVSRRDGKLMEFVRAQFNRSKKIKPVHVPDVREILKEEMRNHFGVLQYIGVPLGELGDPSGGKGKFFGILNLTEKLDGGDYDRDDLDLAGALGSVFSLILKNVR